MSNQANRVYSFYNATCGLGPEYFVDYLKGNVCPQRQMVLYYRLTVSPSDSTNNSSNTDFVTDPAGTGIYRGIENRFMVESDFVTYNKNMLTFIGYRTPKNPAFNSNPTIQVPDLYNETININIEPYENNFIQASANYIDEGSGFETSVPYVDYTVSAASGVFAGFKNIRIIFYNNGNPPGFTGLGKVRKVIIT